MKLKFSGRPLLLGLIYLTAGSARSGAANRYWDTTGAVAGTGATPTGTWGTGIFWSDSATGASTTQGWINGNTAIFSAGSDAINAFTVLLSGNQTIAGLTVEEGAPTISGGGTLVLNNSFTPFSITSSAKIDSTISGTNFGIQKSGAGTLFLTGNNTYTGETYITGGTVNVGNLSNYGVAGSLGNRSGDAGTSNVGIHFNGGTLQYTGSTAQSTNRQIRVGLNGATLDASGTGTGTMSFTNINPNVDIWEEAGGRTLNLTGSNTGNNVFAINWQAYSTGVATSGITKSGAGTWVLTNTHNSDPQTNTYDTFGGYGGGTVISGGILAFVENAIGGGVVNFTGNSTLRWETGNTQDISVGSGPGLGAVRSVKIEDGVTATFNTNGNNVVLGAVFGLGVNKTGAVTKTGSGALTLSAVNIYTGLTTVSGGKLTIAPSGTINSTSGVSIAGGEFSYNSATALSKTVSFSGTGGTLTGTGTITNAVTVTSGNTYSAGALGDPGTQTFSNNLAFGAGSIFSWDLDVPGSPTTLPNQGNYDKVTVNGTLSGTPTGSSPSVFSIVLGTGNFAETFWNSDRNWNNIFTSGAVNLASLFGSFGGSVGSNGIVAGQGSFSFSGASLNWTAVPEPSTALAGLLLGAGLLRRSRKKRALSW